MPAYPFALGTDEALADDSINLWTAMKIAGLVHNITDPEYRNWPAADEILACVYDGGARAMGLENLVGALAPGYQADITVLDLNEIAFTPLNDVRRQLVYCENGSSVRMTMVAGRILVRDGRVCSVDEEGIKEEAREFALAYADDEAVLQKTAADLEPFYREMYLRATDTDVGMNRLGIMRAPRVTDKPVLRPAGCKTPNRQLPARGAAPKVCETPETTTIRLAPRMVSV